MWSFRLQQELKASMSAFFITLTYDDSNLTYGSKDATLVKRDIQLWLKRLRKRLGPFRYFLVGEYGPQTNRPHYHGLLFNLDVLPANVTNEISQSWNMGHVLVGTVNPNSIGYVAKYTLNSMTSFVDKENQFMMCSNKPGIGFSYIEKNGSRLKQNKQHFGILDGGVKVPLPRYYKEKIFSKVDLAVNSKIYSKKLLKDERKLDEKLTKRGDSPAKYVDALRAQVIQRIKDKSKQNQKL